MSGKTVIVLGGGFGGLAAANELRKRLSAEHRIVIVERSRTFTMGLSNLWLMTGERPDPSQGRRGLEALKSKGIEYVNEQIISIDPSAKKVQTSSGVHNSDYLIVALGAELAPNEITGFSESALNFYATTGALKLRAALQEIREGNAVLLITRTPFRCPAAPYEAAFLIDSLLRKRGVRNHVHLAVYTPEPYPMPVAGPEVGSAIQSMLRERGIEYFPEQTVLRIDGSSGKLLFELEEARFDVLAGVPPHTAPKVVREAGMLGPTGWMPVDPSTLQTRFAGVFAIGDVTAVKLQNGMFLPKAGVFAEAQARVVAENISAEIQGKSGSARFSGEGYCYVEVGDGKAAYGAGDFYASPAPRVKLEPPSEHYRKEKEDFERFRLANWL